MAEAVPVIVNGDAFPRCRNGAVIVFAVVFIDPGQPKEIRIGRSRAERFIAVQNDAPVTLTFPEQFFMKRVGRVAPKSVVPGRFRKKVCRLRGCSFYIGAGYR
ncbi:hypothetical protein QS257_19360 [Terrilactibacillus sp. S3-3]|nr:hypothetical protein QS257_19360 [Terrilactibacillus sp. S3-3]